MSGISRGVNVEVSRTRLYSRIRRHTTVSLHKNSLSFDLCINKKGVPLQRCFNSEFFNTPIGHETFVVTVLLSSKSYQFISLYFVHYFQEEDIAVRIELWYWWYTNSQHIFTVIKIFFYQSIDFYQWMMCNTTSTYSPRLRWNVICESQQTAVNDLTMKSVYHVSTDQNLLNGTSNIKTRLWLWEFPSWRPHQ